MESVYQSCFNLVHTYIYGGVELTSDMSLVATLIATIASIFLFALPFIIVFWLISIICNAFSWWR